MPTRFSLAKVFESLLDTEDYPPWLIALFSIPLAILFIWFISNQRLPTKEEDTLYARQLNRRALIIRKRLNVRNEPVLDIEQGTLLAEEIDWGNTFFLEGLVNDSFPTNSREDYLQAKRYSLVAYASTGDSLIKKRGELLAVVKRGRLTRTFYFHSLWP